MKKDYCKDFIIFLCVIGLVVCIYSIYRLNSRVTELESYHVETESGYDVPENIIIKQCVLALKLASANTHKMHKITDYIGSDPRWFRAFCCAYFTKK